MPSLQVRELPENIYHLLQKKAKAEHRSLAQEAVATLATGLQAPLSPKKRRLELLEKIIAEPTVDQSILDIDPVKLLREDRDR